MKTQIIRLTVDATITFSSEQDRLNAVEYAKHLILTTNGTGVKFTSISPNYEETKETVTENNTHK